MSPPPTPFHLGSHPLACQRKENWLTVTIQRLVGKGSHQVNSKILRIEMSVDQCVQCVKIERVVEKVWPAQHLPQVSCWNISDPTRSDLLSWVASQVARKLLSELIFSDSISESEVEFLQHLALMPDSSPLLVVGGTQTGIDVLEHQVDHLFIMRHPLFRQLDGDFEQGKVSRLCCSPSSKVCCPSFLLQKREHTSCSQRQVLNTVMRSNRANLDPRAQDND